MYGLNHCWLQFRLHSMLQDITVLPWFTLRKGESPKQILNHFYSFKIDDDEEV